MMMLRDDDESYNYEYEPSSTEVFLLGQRPDIVPTTCAGYYARICFWRFLCGLFLFLMTGFLGGPMLLLIFVFFYRRSKLLTRQFADGTSTAVLASIITAEDRRLPHNHFHYSYTIIGTLYKTIQPIHLTEHETEGRDHSNNNRLCIQVLNEDPTISVPRASLLAERSAIYATDKNCARKWLVFAVAFLLAAGMTLCNAALLWLSWLPRRIPGIGAGDGGDDYGYPKCLGITVVAGLIAGGVLVCLLSRKSDVVKSAPAIIMTTIISAPSAAAAATSDDDGGGGV